MVSVETGRKNESNILKIEETICTNPVEKIEARNSNPKKVVKLKRKKEKNVITEDKSSLFELKSNIVLMLIVYLKILTNIF